MNYRRGLIGEDVAISYITSLHQDCTDFELFEKRYKNEYGEIDLVFIARSKMLILCIEVKTVKQSFELTFDSISTIITHRQITRIYNSATQLKHTLNLPEAFDIIIEAVIVSNLKVIHHIKNISL